MKHKINLDALKPIQWTFCLAWKINKRLLLFWFSINAVLSIAPAIMLSFNKEIISTISNFVSVGEGAFSDVIWQIVILGSLLAIIGLSGRINGDLLYLIMYDSYYIGMQDILIEKIHKVDLKTLMQKEVKDEYNAIISRAGSLTLFMSSFCSILAKFIAMISLLVIAYSTSLVVFTFSLIYVVVITLYTAKYTQKNKAYISQMKERERKTAYYQNMPMNESIAKEIRIFNLKNKINRQWHKAFDEIEVLEKKRVFHEETKSFISGMLYYIVFSIIILYSIFRVSQGLVTVDIFILIYTLGERLSYSIHGITTDFILTNYALQSLEMQRNFILKTPEWLSTNILDKSDYQYANNINSTVFEFQDVSFSYNESSFVLKNINLKILKGETIALVGYNGSGKTTLVSMLLEIFKPDSGEILYYGKPFSTYPKGYIKNQIGAFFQDFYIFHASRKDNIGMGDIQDIQNTERILKSIEDGDAEKILRKFPLGLEQWIGKDVEQEGAVISGGEKYKIAISRTHMSDKEIYIFDEPAAALDPIAEMNQFLKIKNKMKGKTTILISHRIGFARLAEKIIVMEKGHIAEIGTHEELMKKDGTYAYLYKEQSQWYENNKGEEYND